MELCVDCQTPGGILCEGCHELRIRRLGMATRKAYREMTRGHRLGVDAAPQAADGAVLVYDSWWEPTAAQIAQAKAEGAGAWCGYFAGPGIFHGWADATFQRVLAGGLRTAAYCSQASDPAQVKAHAAALGIVAILDDEPGIHPDDSGTDPWLETSGARLYGGSAVIATHLSHGHSGYVFAAYPGGAQVAAWPPGVGQPNPARPMGWQWADPAVDPLPVGSVDVSNFDPAILGAPKEADVTSFILFPATITAGPQKGLVGQFLSNKMRFRYISGTEAPDLPGVIALGGDTLTEWPGDPVGDVGAFGNPDDGATAAMLGLPFGTGVALTVAGTIEDQGGGKSSLSGTATPV